MNNFSFQPRFTQGSCVNIDYVFLWKFSCPDKYPTFLFVSLFPQSVILPLHRQILVLLHFTLLHFIDTVFFYKFMGGHVLNKTSFFFQQHLLTLWLSHHILRILATFQAFSLLLYLLMWSVISDLWYYYYDPLKAQVITFFSNKVFSN